MRLELDLLALIAAALTSGLHLNFWQAQRLDRFHECQRLELVLLGIARLFGGLVGDLLVSTLLLFLFFVHLCKPSLNARITQQVTQTRWQC